MPFGARFYSLKMGLSAATHQAELIQRLKSNGDDVIQTSDGLCVKTQMSHDELQSFVGDENASGISVNAIDASEKNQLSKDVVAFMGLG